MHGVQMPWAKAFENPKATKRFSGRSVALGPKKEVFWGLQKF
jgi:hypothetical protein